jgi:nucleotide-binding universal stress UspA family protein
VFRRILVPVDFSPRSLRAARSAARVAAAGKAQVTLLHVIEKIEDTDARSLSGFYSKLERAARSRMQPFVEILQRRGIAVEAVTLYGKPVNEILRFAEENRSDLIVLSSHKLPLRHGEGWGTVSYKVGILARCPVLLVK